MRVLINDNGIPKRETLERLGLEFTLASSGAR